jgi:hypothetical protein
MKQEKKELAEMRQTFKLKLMQNPDYFGHLTEAGLALEGIQPVLKLVANTAFEELTCLSYNPETEDLRAVVQVKQTGGYSGGPCTDGSKEYVRFYVDYNRDGDWVDEGVVNFDAHDLPFPQTLSYAVKKRIQPKVQRCCFQDPVLPRVRAILSWNLEPPAGQPGWLPPWGDRLEADIQIAPRNDLWCWIHKHLDDLQITIEPAKLKKLSELPLVAQVQPLVAAKPALAELIEAYGDQVQASRFAYDTVHALSLEASPAMLAESISFLEAAGINVAEVIDFYLAPSFNTTYEEVKCVGLNRDLSVLHAGIQIKRAAGYSGGLCTPGSREYVAFYMNFGGDWEYMGTSAVRVHDIPDIPDDGLWYNAALPVTLTDHQKAWCQTGKAKVRAILSWNVAPPPNTPGYVAHWGDWQEAYVEIRPLPAGVVPGDLVPYIQTVGGMPIDYIDASGYANGTAPDGLTGIDSPFDGRIEITGLLFNATESPLVRYRVMVWAPSTGSYQPCVREFPTFRTVIIGNLPVDLPLPRDPDANGWLDYYPTVYENLLGVYVPAEKGLHRVKLQMEDPVTSAIVDSNVVAFMVDKGKPTVDVEITSGTGNCGVFTKGDLLKGTFSITDEHCYSVGLSVTPKDEANGAVPTIDGSGGKSALVYKAGLTCPTTSGTWELNTAPMDPCGYNIRIHGVDRTIVNSRWRGRDRWDIEGFCLMADDDGGGGGGCC